MTAATFLYRYKGILAVKDSDRGDFLLVLQVCLFASFPLPAPVVLCSVLAHLHTYPDLILSTLAIASLYWFAQCLISCWEYS